MEGKRIAPPDVQIHHAVTPSALFSGDEVTGGFQFLFEADDTVIHVIREQSSSAGVVASRIQALLVRQFKLRAETALVDQPAILSTRPGAGIGLELHRRSEPH